MCDVLFLVYAEWLDMLSLTHTLSLSLSLSFSLFLSLSLSLSLSAGEVLEGVHLTPRDREESRENVERVLQFISSKHIRMPHTSARGMLKLTHTHTHTHIQSSKY